MKLTDADRACLKNIGIEMKKKREAKNCSQEELGRLTDIRSVTISKIEAGKMNASFAIINRLFKGIELFEVNICSECGRKNVLK